jgi:hypothetical protein
MYLHLCPVVTESSQETILEVHHAHSLTQYVACQLPTSAAANLHAHAQTKACCTRIVIVNHARLIVEVVQNGFLHAQCQFVCCVVTLCILLHA